jgi:hypothetical protein
MIMFLLYVLHTILCTYLKMGIIGPYPCEWYFLPLGDSCTTTSTSSSTTTTTTTTTSIPITTTTSTTSFSTTTTTTIQQPVTTTTTTSSSSTSTTTTTQIPPVETWCLYWDDTSMYDRTIVGGDDIQMRSSQAGQYVDARDNVAYGGDTTIYTNNSILNWNTNRTGWYVEFIIDGVTYGPYIYDIVGGSVAFDVPPGEFHVDQNPVQYSPPINIHMFGTIRFSTTPYFGTLDAIVLTIAAGDEIRIYKQNCNENLLL